MRKFHFNLVLLVLSLLIPLCISTNLKAQTYTLEIVADKQTLIPFGSGTFTDVLHLVSLGGGDVVFKAIGSLQEGIYTFKAGTLGVVADLSTAIPGGSGTFTNRGFFDIVSLGGGDVAFRGEDSSGQLGVYTFIAGTLGVVADTNTPIPGGFGELYFSSQSRIPGRRGRGI